MKEYGKKILDKLLQAEAGPDKLAWSIAIGLYLAFSPYVGLQTPLVFVFAFLLQANAAVIFTVLYAVNNPFTMVPLAVMDYAFGHWLIEGCMCFDLSAYDPPFMNWINDYIGPYILPYLGLDEFCFWCFMIGGNIIALSVAIGTYPFVKRFSHKLLKKKPQAKKS